MHHLNKVKVVGVDVYSGVRVGRNGLSWYEKDRSAAQLLFIIFAKTVLCKRLRVHLVDILQLSSIRT